MGWPVCHKGRFSSVSRFHYLQSRAQLYSRVAMDHSAHHQEVSLCTPLCCVRWLDQVAFHCRTHQTGCQRARHKRNVHDHCQQQARAVQVRVYLNSQVKRFATDIRPISGATRRPRKDADEVAGEHWNRLCIEMGWGVVGGVGGARPFGREHAMSGAALIEATSCVCQREKTVKATLFFDSRLPSN